MIFRNENDEYEADPPALPVNQRRNLSQEINIEVNRVTQKRKGRNQQQSSSVLERIPDFLRSAKQNEEQEIIDERRRINVAENRKSMIELMNNLDGDDDDDDDDDETNKRLLIDIPFNELISVLLTLVNSMTYIPSRYVKQCRNIMIKYADNIIRNKNNELLWKKYFLLTVVLFTDIQGSRRAGLDDRIKSLSRDDWSTFTVGMFRKARYKKKSIGKGLEFHEESEIEEADTEAKKERLRQQIDQWDNKIKALAKAGDIGKVMKMVDREGHIGVVTDDTIMRLQAKHPQPIEEMPVEFINMAPSKVSLDLGIHKDSVRAIIVARPKGVKDGPDKMRYDLLRTLVGSGGVENSDEEKFSVSIGNMISILVNGEAPNMIYEFLHDNQLIPVSKPDSSDVRPVGMGFVLRKITSIFILRYTSHATSAIHTLEGEDIPFNDHHFNGLQYGLEKIGTEKIIHSCRAHQELNPDQDCYLMDAENGFNNSSRVVMLQEVKKHFPALLPFISRMYGTDSIGWVLMGNEVKKVVAREGFSQGDVLASWLYCLGQHPLQKMILDEINTYNVNTVFKFFIDDGNSIAPFELQCKIIEMLIEHGPQYGYILNRIKGKYSLGQCHSDSTAKKRKKILVKKYGFNPDVIMLHPSNGGDILKYGAKVLGSCIGSEDFCQQFMEQKIVKLDKTKSNIISKIRNIQIRQLVLKWCFTQKWIFLNEQLLLFS